MKNLFALCMAIMAILPSRAQSLTVKKVICTEYHAFYLASDGQVYAYMGGASKPVPFPIAAGRTIKDASGAFNEWKGIDDQGYVWSNRVDLTTKTDRYNTDSTGAAFDKNASIYAYKNTILTIRTDGSIWYFGADDYDLFSTAGVGNMRPMQLSPAGMTFKKIALGSSRIVALTTAGDVYEWILGKGRTPAKKTTPAAAIDIWASHFDYAGCIIQSAAGATNGYPYVWGVNWGSWGAKGGPTYSQPTNVTSLWGLKYPITEINVDWNTTHYIDTQGDMYGFGFNPQGEVGNGEETVNKYNYPNFPGYGWTFNDGENPVTAPAIQIGKGVKWSHLYSNNWFVFYKYAMDVNGNIYAWGRNKAVVCGNGYYLNQQADHPNSMDVLVPTKVTPLTTASQAYDWTAPKISAGANQTISSSTATLTGSATGPQLIKSGTAAAANGINKVGFDIVSYQWTKVSGNGGNITSPGSASTTVTGLTTGTYVFNLLTTDANTGTQSANVTITVSGVGAPSSSVSVSAGSATTLTLPINSTILSGSASTTSGTTISSYAWSQTSGPSTASIGTPATASTTVSSLVAGTYTFKLTATNNSGVTGSSTVTVTVNAATSTVTYTAIPATIQGEAYYKMSGVATETCGDTGGGLDVGQIDPSDWMSYNINVPTAGTYNISFRYASNVTGIAFSVKNAAGAGLAAISTGSTGGWQTYSTVSIPITLPAGNQTITISSSGNNWNLNWLQISAQSSSSTGSGLTIPGTIQAESYSSMNGVQKQTTTDAGGGTNVDYITNGSWMKYDVNVTTAGTYTVGFRYATINSGAKFQLKNASGTTLASMAPAATGGWQTWQTVTATITLPAGQQTLQLYCNAVPLWNLNWMSFTQGTTSAVEPGASVAEGQSASLSATTVPDATADAAGAASLTLFPNPVKDQFTIALKNAPTGSASIRIFSQSGLEVKTYMVNVASQDYRIDLSTGNIAAGVYFVRIQIGNWTRTIKMVKI